MTEYFNLIHCTMKKIRDGVEFLLSQLRRSLKILRKNRSSENFFFNKALVSFEYQRKTIPMIYSDLMTTTKEVKNLDLKKQLLEGDKHLNIYEKKMSL